jgi:hypothetical protein
MEDDRDRQHACHGVASIHHPSSPPPLARSIFAGDTQGRNKTGRGSIEQPNSRAVPHVCGRVSLPSADPRLAAHDVPPPWKLSNPAFQVCMPCQSLIVVCLHKRLRVLDRGRDEPGRARSWGIALCPIAACLSRPIPLCREIKMQQKDWMIPRASPRLHRGRNQLSSAQKAMSNS